METAKVTVQLLIMVFQLVAEGMKVVQGMFDKDSGMFKKEVVMASVKELVGEEVYLKIEGYISLFIDLKKAIWKLFGIVPKTPTPEETPVVPTV